MVLSALLLFPCPSAIQDPNGDAALALGIEYVRAGRALEPKKRARVDVRAERGRLEQRYARIEDELASLGAHDWAGTYYQGDGLGCNVVLRLAPTGGATYTW